MKRHTLFLVAVWLLGTASAQQTVRTVTLDNYFNNEWKKDSSGQLVPFHYLWSDSSAGGFSTLAGIFDRHGIIKDQLAQAPSSGNLRHAGIYIIVDPDNMKDNPLPHVIEEKDIAVIRKWVKQGGHLLLMGNDPANAELKYFNKLAGAFGIRFNEDDFNKVEGNDYEQGAIVIPSNHPVFPNVKKIFMKELSTLSVVPPARSILTKNSKTIIAVSAYGKGVVMVVGDPWLYNEYTNSRMSRAGYENLEAAADLVDWLAGYRGK